MMKLVLLLLLAAYCYPSSSLVLAFSRSGGIGGVVGATKSKLPYHPRSNNHHLWGGRRSSERTVKLWSISGGDQDDDDDDTSTQVTDINGNTNGVNDVERSTDKMSLAKAQKLLSTFWSMAFPYYQESQPGRRLFYGMILLTLMNSGVSVAFSYISKDFWNALNQKDSQEFYSMMVKFGAALVVGAPVAVFYRYQREQLAVHWREWMTDRTLQLYNSNRVYYALERDIAGSSAEPIDLKDGEAKNGEDNTTDLATAAPRIDNPDQRITEDVRTFTAFSLQLFITVVTSIIDLISFR